jgi:large subunit ribosomal protein L9
MSGGLLMEVILKESISSLGKAGEIVKVADGYARNYLLPKSLAILANKKNVTQLDRDQERILAKAAQLKEEYEAVSLQLQKLDVVIPMRIGEEDKLYGSVTSDIADAVKALGFEVDRRKIQLDEPIKSAGEFDVNIKLNPEVIASLHVRVVPEE